MVEELRAVLRYRDLLVQLIQRNIKVRYKRSVLGLAWTMLNPLLMMAILTLVFSQVFRVTVDHYPVYVLSALVLWNFFAQATLMAASELAWGNSLLQRIYVPRTLFSISAVGTGVVHLLFALVPLAVMVLISGVPLRPVLIVLPISILLTSMFAMGVGLILSILAASFADVVDVYQVALTAWLYLTPVIYPVEAVPTSLQWLLRLNPMYFLLEIFRQPIYSGTLPTWEIMATALALACGALLVGWWFFARNADGLAYRL